MILSAVQQEMKRGRKIRLHEVKYSTKTVSSLLFVVELADRDGYI